MSLKPFAIYTASTSELVGELNSAEVAHQIAHLMLRDWPGRSPLAVWDWTHRTTRFVEVDRCGFAGCSVGRAAS